jgi:integrase
MSHPDNSKSVTQESTETFGVYLLKPRHDRPQPYRIQYRELGQTLSESFATPEEREKRVAKLRRERRRGQNRTLTPDEVSEWQAFKTAIGDTPWQDVVTSWRSGGVTKGSPLVGVAALSYLEAIKPTMAADTMRHKKQKVNLFATAFDGKQLHEITPDDIDTWLDDLGFDNNNTVDSYRRVIHAFYAHFRKQCPINPVSSVDSRSEEKDVITKLDVEDTQRLFAYAQQHAPEVLGRLAFEAFAGVRFASAYRLEKADINFDDKGVLLPKHKLKTKRRHYIDGLPENIWPWLALTNDACWALSPAEYMHAKSQLFEKAKVPHPHNVMRHSFATYHVAAFKDAGKTAGILCHRNQKMLWDHYRGNATEAQGKAYFAIVP